MLGKTFKSQMRKRSGMNCLRSLPPWNQKDILAFLKKLLK